MIMISNIFLMIVLVTILRSLGLVLGRCLGIFTFCGVIDLGK
jgi:hypothetical protein